MEGEDEKIIYVYSYRPKGAHKQRRWAVATGNAPGDLVSSHGTKATAMKAAQKLSIKLEIARMDVED
jgi:hypothetical protein